MLCPAMTRDFIDWNYSPNDDFQWTLFLNRHFHLRTMMDAYIQTGNDRYCQRINDDIRDWIITRPYEGKGLKHLPTNKQWQWSLLEVASRGEIWPKVFYALYDQLDDDVKILLLSSVSDHLSCLRNFHSRGGNHLALELKGLAMMAGSFREFKNAEPYLDYAENGYVQKSVRSGLPRWRAEGIDSTLSWCGFPCVLCLCGSL